jgi:glycine/D-amino acid oxidase-like deaminating enzyme
MVSILRWYQMRVVICGGGVIGACSAHYLTRAGATVTVIERTGVANASSGKSGGFLALDWCAGSALDEMAQRSFGLHKELAITLGDELDLDWGYRTVDTLSVAASVKRDLSQYSKLPGPGWLGDRCMVHDRIGTPETTAQLDPAAFTLGMMRAAETHGARLQTGIVDGLVLSADGRRARGVLVDGEPIDADAVLIAMGPWSILACRWLPLPGTFGLKGHSLVFRFQPQDSATVFAEIEAEDGAVETPEIVPRMDGTTYVCGLSSQALMPEDPARVTSDEGAFDKLRELTACVSSDLADAEILARQACHRPVTEDGLPFIGAVPGVQGAFIATGHSVWGMLNGPATGEAIAELLLQGAARHIDLTPFSPGRMPPLDPDRLTVK